MSDIFFPHPWEYPHIKFDDNETIDKCYREFEKLWDELNQRTLSKKTIKMNKKLGRIFLTFFMCFKKIMPNSYLDALCFEKILENINEFKQLQFLEIPGVD